MHGSRSAFAQKLLQFPDTVLSDDAAFARRGKWHEFFSHRMQTSSCGRIVFEIGCFDAAFLARVAARSPEVAFIGIDWKCKALYAGAQHVADAGLRNVALIHGRGQDIARIFAHGELDEIWLFHPDPCDRPAELKNRLFAEPFLLDAHKVLRDSSSTLTLKTDHPGYYQWALALYGLPQPPWFSAAREARLRGTAVPAGVPRVRARDIAPDHAIPACRDSLLQRFTVAVNTPDFWGDSTAQSITAGRCFAGLTTKFEARFISKRQPIYLLELRKNNLVHESGVGSTSERAT